MLKSAICCALVVAFSFSPKVCLALEEAKPKLIETFDVLNLEDRSIKERAVESFASKKRIREALEKQGLSSEVISRRVSALTDKELKILADSVEKGKAGALLVEIVLILLIIYLARRI